MEKLFGITIKLKIIPFNPTPIIIKSMNDKTFYVLTQNIRNLQMLSSNELNYINSLQHNELLHLIHLYNSIILSVHELILSDE
jgi:hypothetical protein